MTGRCPEPTKARFPTRGRAVKAAKSLKRSGAPKFRPYRCRCGAWHLTSAL